MGISTTTTAVLFDLYETLITEFVSDWQPQPTVAEHLGIDAADFAAAWQLHHPDRMRGVHPDYTAALRAICQALAHPADAVLLDRLHQERLAIKAIPFARIELGIVRLLDQLRRRRLRLGLVSNCAPEEVAAWPTCALAPYFDAVVFSYEVGTCKPERAIYQLACQRLGVTPSEVVFIGDGGSDELVGAARVGLRPYWATWFLDRWSAWKRSATARRENERFPQLGKPAEVLRAVQGAGETR
jgi:HAD superfamily hydrolase (TIGR01509 family)